MDIFIEPQLGVGRINDLLVVESPPFFGWPARQRHPYFLSVSQIKLVENMLEMGQHSLISDAQHGSNLEILVPHTDQGNHFAFAYR